MKYEIMIREPQVDSLLGSIVVDINKTAKSNELITAIKNAVVEQAKKYYPDYCVSLLCRDTDMVWVLAEDFTWKLR